MSDLPLDPTQAAAAAQFDRQSSRYGRTHLLADVSDVRAGLAGLAPAPGTEALDVATGGGHTAVLLGQLGWRVTAGDISARMLEQAARLAAEVGVTLALRRFPAEDMPFPAATFALVTARVAPHHFSSPEKFVREVARVLEPGGRFLLIDGSVPDNDPETESWLQAVERWRDPSHVRFLSRAAWESLVAAAGLQLDRRRCIPCGNPTSPGISTRPRPRRKIAPACSRPSAPPRRPSGRRWTCGRSRVASRGPGSA